MSKPSPFSPEKYQQLVKDGVVSRYVDPEVVAKSYRPKAGYMSPGLQRARAPFRARNAITGITLGAFVALVYSYSLTAVKQEQFDDIDAEARALQLQKAREEQMAKALSQEDEKRAMEAATEFVVSGKRTPLSTTIGTAATSTLNPPSLARSRGILAPWIERYVPGLLDPHSKTLVWGAPPVDNVGTIHRKL